MTPPDWMLWFAVVVAALAVLAFLVLCGVALWASWNGNRILPPLKNELAQEGDDLLEELT